MKHSQRVAEQVARMPPELKEVLDRELAAGNEVVEVIVENTPPQSKVSLRMNHPFRADVGKLPAGVEYRERSDRDPLTFEFLTADGRWSVMTAKFKPLVLEPLPLGPDPMQEYAAAAEIVRAREEAAAAKKALDANKVEDLPIWAANFSDAAKRFLKSMKITYEMWHDGDGYDLAALAAVPPGELGAITNYLIEHEPRDWRDIEALATMKSTAAQSAIAKGLQSHDVHVRREAMKYAVDQVSPEEQTRALVRALNSASFDDGLGAAIDEAADFHPAEVVQALLDGLIHRDGTVAVNFAAMLFFIHGKSAEPFDWNHRPFFLRFQTSDMAARREAFTELCKVIGVDPGGA